ncbi:hypothetical protein EDB81DRAFT_511909 [Dactylonectria macrodidyma]|uniref:Uncharacterized protein n=1 Tax=Dactylonectria macrodidyma TaxID=307937 RepID=A0A9P9J6T5_9HYPO|nr:hypothetical protein EDB81DRAFT_511909 [Dactylonectria macrodidyma]
MRQCAWSRSRFGPQSLAITVVGALVQVEDRQAGGGPYKRVSAATLLFHVPLRCRTHQIGTSVRYVSPPRIENHHSRSSSRNPAALPLAGLAVLDPRLLLAFLLPLRPSSLSLNPSPSPSPSPFSSSLPLQASPQHSSASASYSYSASCSSGALPLRFPTLRPSLGQSTTARPVCCRSRSIVTQLGKGANGTKAQDRSPTRRTTPPGPSSEKRVSRFPFTASLSFISIVHRLTRRHC